MLLYQQCGSMPRHEQWDFDLNGLRIVICQGNIVTWRPQDKQDIAVVNAANEELLGAVGDDEDYSNLSINFILYCYGGFRMLQGS